MFQNEAILSNNLNIASFFFLHLYLRRDSIVVFILSSWSDVKIELGNEDIRILKLHI